MYYRDLPPFRTAFKILMQNSGEVLQIYTTESTAARGIISDPLHDLSVSNQDGISISERRPGLFIIQW